jgi:8-oxo-dGTP pyrophosphatase MutT (NUDIX family)
MSASIVDQRKSGLDAPRVADTRPFRASRLRRLRGCDEVSAVCYRIAEQGIEFLLVHTRGGRWTFPKGGVEAGLTHAQAAAMEAYEEAGVHGRIEEAAFACYRRRDLAVNAYLCEVLRLEPPQESGRNRTWFSAQKAKRRLREDRTPAEGAEFARVIDRAVARIRRVKGPDHAARHGMDALQASRFEGPATVHGRIEQAAFVRYTRRQRADDGSPDEIELAVKAYLGKVLRLDPTQSFRDNATLIAERMPGRLPRLPVGNPPAAPKVEFIDGVRGPAVSGLRKRQK